ncbi:MAG: HD domain-containing protein [Nanoarchaeota archaeon]|nr:HD domain-containing protein [Nanoarchaeota archaeon]
MTKQLIKDLKEGERVRSFFSIKYKHIPKEYSKGYMFTLGLADKSGEIELTFFGDENLQKVTELYEQLKEDNIIFVEGIANSYKGKLKIVVNDLNSIRPAKEGEYQLSDFIYVSNQDIEELFSYIMKKKDEVKNEKIKELLNYFLKDEQFVKKFKKCPAAMYKHHACVGGLLEHTWGVLKICETMKKLHPSLDNDLLIAGAILHDIGKLEEFRVTTNIKISEKGMLLSHVYIGAEMVSEAIKAIGDFPVVLKNKLIHIILSHHGELEFGALKKPEFPEAVAVALADRIDSQITQYILLKKNGLETTEDFRIYSKDHGEIYLK